ARAIDLYRRALAGEPRLALAQAGLAEAYLQEAIFHFGALDPRRAFDLAGQASRAALALDPSLASAHATLGHVAFLAERDFERAERHYRRAVEQSPPRAQAHQRYAWFLLTLGHRAAARRQIDLALDAEPLDVNANAAFGLFLHLVGENAAARTHLEATHRRHPDSALPLLPLARLAESEGRYRESLRWYRVAEKILGAETETRAGVAYASARLGRIADARAVLAELEARAASGEYVAQYHLAAVRLGLGERRAALDGLLRASEDRSLWLPWLRFDHRLAPLENEGAFRELLCSIGVDRPGSSSAPVAVADQGVGAAFFTASSTPSSKVRKLSTNIRASSRACAS
ncbi:MAG: tetratricopeptide repeat protein, partial [Acidobacteriota bacterium]